MHMIKQTSGAPVDLTYDLENDFKQQWDDEVDKLSLFASFV